MNLSSPLPRTLRLPAPALLALLLALTPRAALPASLAWDPVPPADMASRQPLVDPTADAEILFSRILVQDQLTRDYIGSIVTHFVRVKVYTERGRDEQSRVQIPLRKGASITDIAGRTIRPDGSTQELSEQSIVEKSIVKASGISVRSMSFVLPGVEVGSILEYRWRESRNGRLGVGTRIDLAGDIPVRRLDIAVQPVRIPRMRIMPRVRGVNVDLQPLLPNLDGTYATSVVNLPGGREEPFMPPESSVKPWAILDYDLGNDPDPAQFWKAASAALFKDQHPAKPDPELQKMAVSMMEAARDKYEGLVALEGFCRTHVRVADPADPKLSEADRKWLERSHRPAEVLRQRLGTVEGVNQLFVALAEAAGFETRIALRADRREEETDQSNILSSFSMTEPCVAVRYYGLWNAFMPAATDWPAGMQPWWFEGQPALVPDPGGPFWATAAQGTPGESWVGRRAALRLASDGSLQGEVSEAFHGQTAALRLRESRDRTPEQQSRAVEKEVQSRLPGAIVDSVVERSRADADTAFQRSYHVRVPAPAQTLGTHVLLRPSYFGCGRAAILAAKTRRHPVWFPFAWSERDSVVIELPEGYRLDAPVAPASISIPQLGAMAMGIQFVPQPPRLILTRSLVVGDRGKLRVGVGDYPRVQGAFEAIKQCDETVVSVSSGAALPR